MELVPVGVMPRYIWLELRRTALEDAIARYEEAKRDVPEAWRAELVLIADWLKGAWPKGGEKLNGEQ